MGVGLAVENGSLGDIEAEVFYLHPHLQSVQVKDLQTAGLIGRVHVSAFGVCF